MAVDTARHEELRRRLAQRESFFGGVASSRLASAAPGWRPGPTEPPPQVQPAADHSRARAEPSAANGRGPGGSGSSSPAPSTVIVDEAARKRRLAAQLTDFDSLGSGGSGGRGGRGSGTPPARPASLPLLSPKSQLSSLQQRRQQQPARSASPALQLQQRRAAPAEEQKRASPSASGRCGGGGGGSNTRTWDGRPRHMGMQPPAVQNGGAHKVTARRHVVVSRGGGRKAAAGRRDATMPSAAGLTGRQKADSALTAAVRAHLPTKPLNLPGSLDGGSEDQPRSPRAKFSGAAAARAARAAAAADSGGSGSSGAAQQSSTAQLHGARGLVTSAADSGSDGLRGRTGARPGAAAAAAACLAAPPKDLGDDLEDDFDDWVEAAGDGEEDWRAELRAVTGYDPSRFRDEPFDDRSMEVGYAEMQAEERRSARAGRDADAREEAAERARQAAKKKRLAEARARLKQKQSIGD